jgi:hypothetical protein
MEDLLSLRMDKPQHMSHLEVDDHGGAAVPAVKLERICTQIPSLPLGLAQLSLAAFPFRVELREPRALDLFHDVSVEACRGRYRLEGLPQGEQVTHEGKQQQRDALA